MFVSVSVFISVSGSVKAPLDAHIDSEVVKTGLNAEVVISAPHNLGSLASI